MGQFYIITQPGFENLSIRELNEKIPGLAVGEIEKGGYPIEAPDEIADILVSNLKIPTRILLRLHEGRYRDFPKLFKAFKKLNWREWIGDKSYSLSVSASKSRLNNEKRIRKTIVEAIGREPKEDAEEAEVVFYIRNYNDEVTLSRSLSSSALFKRGYKVLEGVAPIRENIAAGLFYFCEVSAGQFNTVVDPMSGTGTLLLEAQSFNWPGEETKLNHFYAFDKNKEALQILQENLSSMQKLYKKKAAKWNIVCRDVMSDEPIDIVGDRRLILANPPYGKRIKFTGSPKEFYENLFQSMLRFSPTAVGFIFPRSFQKFVPRESTRFARFSDLNFSNGGIPVTFRLWY